MNKKQLTTILSICNNLKSYHEQLVISKDYIVGDKLVMIDQLDDGFPYCEVHLNDDFEIINIFRRIETDLITLFNDTVKEKPLSLIDSWKLSKKLKTESEKSIELYLNINVSNNDHSHKMNRIYKARISRRNNNHCKKYGNN